MKSKESINLAELMNTGVDFVNIDISKEEVLNQDISSSMNALRQLLIDPKVAIYFMEKIDVYFEGYNDYNEELWEIPEVRNYISKLDAEFPYWLYFLSKKGGGLYVIVKSFLLPFLTTEGDEKYNMPKLHNYLLERGFPAMNVISDFTNMTDIENKEISDRVLKYFFK